MRKIFTLLAIMLVSMAQAQWNTDTAVNTLVSDSETDDMQALGTSDGETYVVYWKSVPAPTNFELRMQVLDADGNQTLGAEGILVSDQIPMNTFTVVWKTIVDADDNIYISVTGTGGGDPGFVFKLDNNGNQLWGANGVSIGSGNLVTVLPLSSGDAIVGWFDAGMSFMQRYDSAGVAVWTNTQPITTGSGFAAPANFFEISGGDFIVVFHKLLSGISSNLYAQRYNASGMSQWANATQLSSNITRFNRLYSGGQLGDAIFMSTSSPMGSRFDAFLQRVNPDGSLPWGINGVDFDTNTTVNEGPVSMVVDASSMAVYAVSNYSNLNQGMNGMKIQKFDANSGARQFTDTAKEVFAIGEEKVNAAKMHLLDGTPWFLIKTGVDNGANPITLDAVYLDEDGEFVWLEETRPVATFADNKARVNYTQPVNSQSVAVFIEDKGTGEKIYAQNFEDTITCALSITCPSDVVVNTDAGVCVASGVVLGVAVTNNCPGEMISNNAPANFPIGDTMVTWTVTNGGNTETCMQMVTVEDTTDPVISCAADQTVIVPQGTLYTLPDYFANGEASATDNCTTPVVITSQDPIVGTELADGVYQIDLTAEDEYGNAVTCSFELTVDEILGVNSQTDVLESISMFPNPAGNVITFSNPMDLNLNLVRVYDVSGRLIKTFDLTNIGSDKTFDISEMAEATYFAVIEGELGKITKQLIKM